MHDLTIDCLDGLKIQEYIKTVQGREKDNMAKINSKDAIQFIDSSPYSPSTSSEWSSCNDLSAASVIGPKASLIENFRKQISEFIRLLKNHEPEPVRAYQSLAKELEKPLKLLRKRFL